MVPRFALLVKVDNDSCDDLPALLRLFQSAGVDGIELSGLDMARRDGQKTPLLPGPPAGCLGRPHRTHLPGGRRLFPRCGRKGAGRRCPLCLPLQGADLSARLRGADGKRPDREPLPGLQPLLQCTASAQCAVCSIPKSSPSWRRCSAPTPPPFPGPLPGRGRPPFPRRSPPLKKKTEKNRKRT